ncbi:PA14 domain-containing protein [Bergeyella sp. RCAD1439]|uniref:PA14 domain-containing protein n=1 Tax=Bergeyella anatis TaxID=3113737 RepID=UPI002E193260|nr:PA14 domain-containing protein [Bergeyella sp. RCAD1439]
MEWLSRWLENSEEKRIPMVVFQHIPLPEYAEGEEMGGEPVSAPQVNSGVFARSLPYSFAMGFFCGHDHDNRYEKLVRGKSLIYGNVSGFDAYGKLPRGGRMVVLRGNQASFYTYTVSGEKLTRSRVYHHPSGLHEVGVEDAFLEGRVSVKAPRKGVRYTYYEGKVKSVSELEGLDPLREGVASGLDLPEERAEDYFGIRYKGYLRIPEDGAYLFELSSDDGAVLKIAEQVVIDNDGSHDVRVRSAKVNLKKGFYPLELLYFEDRMGEELQLQIESLKMQKQRLDLLLFH